MNTIPHVAHHVATLKPIVIQGYSMFSMLISSAVSGGVMFGLGWYVKGRGMTGVQNDLNNVKQDVEALKAKFSPTPVV